MEYQASSLAFSEKLSNGHAFPGNSIYDGVFAAPSKFSGPNFSSRVEDYREIFGGSEASRGSIPFLEVPELNERKISVDVRSSKLDYSNIFGGFEDSNFALPYQEFSRETNKRKKSEQARTPAQRFSPPEPAENYSCGNPVMEEEASHQVKTFNMSYNKINNGIANGANGTNGMTHIPHVHAVQSYTCLIDEDDKAVFSEVNETFPKSNNVCEGKMEGNHFKRAMTDVQAGESGKQTSSSGGEFQNNSNWFKSHTMDKLFGKYEVGQETLRPKVQHSSSLPGKFNLDKAEGNFWTDTTGGSTGLHSPPYFDEEIDTNSVAATSAAALRKAIEEAEVRIKMAKELMERMKAGTRNGVKQSVNDGVKPKERKENEIAYKLNRSKKKKTSELCEEVDIPLHVSSRTREKSPVGQRCVTADFENWEEVKLSNEVDQGTSWKEISSQAGLRQEEADVSEAEHFYEVENAGENWSTAIELDIPVSSEKGNQNVTGPGQVTEDFKVQEFDSSTTEAATETLWNCFKSSQGGHRKGKDEPIEAGEQFYEVESSDKNWATISECEDVKMVQSVDEDGLKEKKIAQEVFEKPQQFIEELKPAEEEDYPEIIKNTIERLNGISGVYDCGMGAGKSMLDVKVSDHEKIDWKEVTLEQEDNEELVQASNENDKCEKKPIEFLAPIEDNGEVGILGLEDVEHMNQSTTREWVENDRRGEEAYKPEGHEKEQNDIHSVEDTERRFVNTADQEEIIDETLNELHLGKQIAKILIHDSRSEDNEKLGGVGGNDKILVGDASEKEENESRQEETCQRIGTERVETKIDSSPGDEEKVKAVLEEPSNQENFLGAVDDVCKQHESDNLSKNEKPTLHAENDDTVEASEEVPACEESGSITEVSDAFLEANESVNELDSVKEKYDMEERDVLETDGIPQGLELTKIVKPMEDKTENAFLDKKDTDNTGRADMNFVQNPNGQHGRQFEIVCSPRKHIEELASEMEKLNEDEESEVAVSQEDDDSNTKCSDEQRWVDNEIDMKAARLSDTSEGEGENVELNEETRMSPSTEKEENHKEIPISESAEQNEKSYQETLPSQSVETNEENHKPTMSVEESETIDSLQKEVELEKEHLRKIDEAKEREREREREKERIAVERAIREARERAFAEARERAAAERAAAGARQRATSEARERVGKTSAETNDKSAAEKVSKEAKLKAERERAAVERATAEARVRALEKAMSGKAASEARKQNPQHKGSFSSSSTRYSHSSNHGVPNNAERFDGADVESVQRCKARSERHQRITERAEKALAEKNRRDLLAQKEQAERNRLAETLDVEVKRWSSGKEGNLRALLSTLQYILGPDSGWQPIPLTDLLTAAAVKKTYRKATLFVHPDKLQQRGASIQQKYTCEKVFDLLKEAWNRFNVEER